VRSSAAFRRLSLAVSLVVLVVAACDSEPSAPRRSPEPSPRDWPTEAWPRATPESEGFDSSELMAALEEAGDTGVFHSLLVVRHGSVVVDAYSYPYDSSTYHDLASVTKSVLTTLLGIAATQGTLDLDASIVSFFPDRTIADREHKEPITVRHLASMTSGLDCSSGAGEITLQQMRASPDWVQFVLDLDVIAEPGTRFSYCSPGMHLLSSILQQATGMSAREFARVNLFEPLGIRDAYWSADPQGVTFGWGDLALHPHDAAKIGFLFLNDGEWDGRQIVSRGWVGEATSARIVGTDHYEDYGYGWWVAPQDAETSYFRADGNGGQRILIVPAVDLVVVTTGGGFEPDFEAILGTATGGGDPLPPDPVGAADLEAFAVELSRGPGPEAAPAPPARAAEISGRTYSLEENEFGIRSIRLDLDDPAEAILRLDVASEPIPRVDRVGLDGTFRPSIEGRPVVARGYWDDPRTFIVECDEGPGLSTYELRLIFDGRRLRLEAAGATIRGSASTQT
jgi:CubicO group peptidase (beta-lactamase class C family)